jgi:SNF2 family DNA or RNA helicase
VLVLHGVWSSAGRLCLWAEDSAASFGSHDTLSAFLGAKGEAVTVSLRLPGRRSGPVASPELVRAAEAKGQVTLRSYDVPVLAYEADDAFDVLCRLASGGFDPAGADVVPGSTVRIFGALAGFAADLVSRGRLLPSIVGEEARWLPVITGPDAATLRAIALALPPAGHAEKDGLDAASVIATALDALLDAAARSARPTDSPKTGRVPKVVGAWLAALTGRARRFKASADERAELGAALAQWQRDATGGAVRACFRLVEPVPDEEDPDAAEVWRLEFALQAADEPSLVVDAERVWRSRGALKALARHIDAPQETLLGELGRASRLYPPLEAALRTAKPAGVGLTAPGAHDLLREGAPLLAAAGFGVLLPKWWSKPSARLGARLSARGTSTAPGTVAKEGGFGLDSVVDYKWELALGDEPLTEAEMERLTSLKAPLVRLRGQWVELDPRRLAAGLQLIGAPAGQMTVGELLHVAGEADEGPGGLPVVGVQAEGWLGELLAGDAEQRLEPIDAPPGFVGTLRPYQRRGLSWLSFLQSAGLGGILADDMGLGKTVQLLALVAADKGTGKTLLVCPMSLVGNWQREAAKFTPELTVHVHHGAERARGQAFATAVAEADLVITTYSVAARDAAALSTMDWHRLVVDEAQAIKNAATRQAVAVRQLPARHRVAVTGTPVENRLADLWSIMEFANPGLLGSATKFKERYAEPIERRGDEAAAERLRRITQPFVLRRVKTDTSIIDDLPEKLEMDVLCNLTAEQASLYQAVVDDMLAKIEASDGIERRGLVLATMTKLKQVCNHPAQLLRDGSRLAGRSGKLARLEEILDEVLAAGEKALLFTQYAEFGAMLRAHLSAKFGREVAYLHGGLGKAERDELVRRFQEGGPASPPLFVLSLKAGGTGLTLTAANHVVHVDRWWNPAVEDQATDRAFRIGQRKSVQVRKFVCAGTVEENISDLIKEKRGLAAKIVGSGESWLTELSTSDLRTLLTLDTSTVVEPS